MPPEPPPDPDAPPPGYGSTPPPPGAPPPAYGAPPPAQQYGGGGYGQPPGAWAGPPLANWGQRAVAALVDYIGPSIVASLVAQGSRGLGSLLQLAALGWALYQSYQGGATGKSMGKQMAGIRLLREQDGQVIGGGLGIGRYFLHIVDALPCFVGYLWPLWDAKRQTFADKILRTVVIVG